GHFLVALERERRVEDDSATIEGDFGLTGVCATDGPGDLDERRKVGDERRGNVLETDEDVGRLRGGVLRTGNRGEGNVAEVAGIGRGGEGGERGKEQKEATDSEVCPRCGVNCEW